MTTQKKLKALVRARMDKTGEPYMVARRHILNSAEPSGYRLHGGIHPETAALAGVLANRGLVDPETGAPLSEAMMLGIGGGLGAGYILWQFRDGVRRMVTTGFRNQWQYPERWYHKTCERLGVPLEVHHTSGPKRARQHLDLALAEGRPAVAFVSAADMPYWHLPADESGWWGYPVTLYGSSDVEMMIDDRNLRPLSMSHDALAAARGRIPSYKHALVVPDAAAVELSAETLRAAVTAGLEDQIEHLGKTSDSFSLPAFRKWSRMLVDGKNPKAWPKVFADGRGLLGALVSSHEAVSDVGILGGNLRRLYATFLAEAEQWVDRPLEDAAAGYRRAAGAWERFAATCLAAPAVKEIVDADARRRAAVAQGDAGFAEAEAAAARSIELMNAGDIGLDEPGRTALFARMAEALRDAHHAEVAAFETLSEVIA